MRMLYRESDRQLLHSTLELPTIRDGQNRNRGEPVMNIVKESSSHIIEKDWDGVYPVAADKKKAFNEFM
jgi:hypothetical protein